jgi:hypothetical protein
MNESQKSAEQTSTGHYAFDDYVKKHPESPEQVMARAAEHTAADEAELARRAGNWKKIKAGVGMTAIAAASVVGARAGMINEAGEAQNDADASHEIQESVNNLQDLDQDPSKANIQVTPTVPAEAAAATELPPLRQSNGE